LALSYSGETDELLAILPALARMGVSLISMTGQLRSTLAQQSVVVLDVTVEREACPLELAPTASTTVMLALGDALAMVILEVRGFTREDFARYHPAGRLGRTLLLKVADVMRGADQIALVSPKLTVREVLVEMNQKRVGAAVVVDGEGRMEGIFTHGDFARHFQTVTEIAGRPVGDFITRTPVTVELDWNQPETFQVWPVLCFGWTSFLSSDTSFSLQITLKKQ
ncbi:MAG: SIS domain-containing protein, partial [Verrucomicrobia bacterium]|nr:SIS domain-containing protein [Verrucomicrobiota bacterium]